MNEPVREGMVQEMLKRAPLVRYSVYTHAQCQCLDNLQQQLLQTLDASFVPVSDAGSVLSIDAGEFNRAYGYFWLWVLGAYEVVRTMCQTPSCFSESALRHLRELKKLLTTVRVPFAKQELAGSREPVAGEPSITGVRAPPVDLVFTIGGQRHTVRDLTNRWREVFAAIRADDILADRRTHYVRARP